MSSAPKQTSGRGFVEFFRVGKARPPLCLPGDQETVLSFRCRSGEPRGGAEVQRHRRGSCKKFVVGKGAVDFFFFPVVAPCRVPCMAALEAAVAKLRAWTVVVWAAWPVRWTRRGPGSPEVYDSDSRTRFDLARPCACCWVRPLAFAKALGGLLYGGKTVSLHLSRCNPSITFFFSQ